MSCKWPSRFPFPPLVSLDPEIVQENSILDVHPVSPYFSLPLSCLHATEPIGRSGPRGMKGIWSRERARALPLRIKEKGPRCGIRDPSSQRYLLDMEADCASHVQKEHTCHGLPIYRIICVIDPSFMRDRGPRGLRERFPGVSSSTTFRYECFSAARKSWPRVPFRPIRREIEWQSGGWCREWV